MKQFKIIFVLFALISAALLLTGCKEDPILPSVTNNTPSGTAGIGRTILIGETVSFTGTASDPDTGDTLTFQWSISSVPAGSAVTSASITGAKTLNASFTPDVPGEYAVQLTISDGVDSYTAQTSVRSVAFAIGLNDNTETHCAYIHNGEFYQLVNPLPAIDECSQNITKIDKGIVYSAGSYIDDKTEHQSVYWKGTTPAAVVPPEVGQFTSFYVSKMAVDPAGNVQLVVIDYLTSTDFRCWIQGQGYIDPTAAISAPLKWDVYIITDLFRSGNDIFQTGTANNIREPSTFFMAKNLVEVVHSATYTPDPLTAIELKGSMFVHGAVDSSSKVYLYGQYDNGSAAPNYNAGYTVNDGEWVTLYHSESSPTDPAQYIKYMASVDDYILNLPDEGSGTSKVFINGTEASMETPHQSEPDVTISNIEYAYMEEINGSMFVTGGFSYSYSIDRPYNVVAVWRDGLIVFEDYDNDPLDGLNYNNASITSADFE